MTSRESHKLENFSPVRPTRAFEEICAQIRREIRRGSLAPTDRLPSERDLAERFQVSRSTVREALRTLEYGGIVTLHKGVKGGAYVQQGDARPITQTVEDLLALGGLSLEEYTEARVAVQSAIIRLACERATDADFAALETNIERTEALGGTDAEARTELTIEFYRLLAEATGNRAMSMLMRTFTEPLRDYINAIGPDRSWDVAASRRKFLACLRARRADDAIAEMVSHMQRLHAYMLGRLPDRPSKRVRP
ncbi:MAG: FadR family transcriptional regulator [Burkholderiaceae bacterium]|nr:FadR family transcriptional regulator [Burkholderiaceae bacterium]